VGAPRGSNLVDVYLGVVGVSFFGAQTQKSWGRHPENKAVSSREILESSAKAYVTSFGPPLVG
jgi:hypothetical protein